MIRQPEEILALHYPLSPTQSNNRPVPTNADSQRALTEEVEVEARKEIDSSSSVSLCSLISLRQAVAAEDLWIYGTTKYWF